MPNNLIRVGEVLVNFVSANKAHICVGRTTYTFTFVNRRIRWNCKPPAAVKKAAVEAVKIFIGSEAEAAYLKQKVACEVADGQSLVEELQTAIKDTEDQLAGLRKELTKAKKQLAADVRRLHKLNNNKVKV